MVAANLGADEVLDPDCPVQFPQSVVSLFRGDLGQPPNGWPGALQKKVLGNIQAINERPGATLAPVNFDAAREELQAKVHRNVSDEELLSWLLYPEVFAQFAEHARDYGDDSRLPTPSFSTDCGKRKRLPWTSNRARR